VSRVRWNKTLYPLDTIQRPLGVGHELL